MRYFFRVEYDGTRYGGWQKQNNALSIQAALEKAFSIVARCPCVVTGAGRTDAGVHARGQGAHVDMPTFLRGPLCRAEISINAILPSDIAIYSLCEVPSDFHARYSARQRIYKYYISTRKQPLWNNRAWTVFHRINWHVVEENLRLIEGRHDFTAFCSSNTSTTNKCCVIYSAKLSLENDIRVFTIQADRYVYKMVRSIVGTLIDIGRGKIPLRIDRIISQRDRSLAGTTAPPWGLVLEWVAYAE